MDAYLKYISMDDPRARKIADEAASLGAYNVLTLAAWKGVRGAELWRKYEESGKNVLRLLETANAEIKRRALL